MHEYRRRKDLECIPANRQIVDFLYDNGKISLEAREESFAFLYYRSKWGVLISRFFLNIGCVLVLSGIFYFFAFNWNSISFYTKFLIIELSIITCIISAYFCSLNRISGSLFLLSGSILVGIFLVVFGRAYQTGTDSYKLFMFWALLTLGWTVISNFSLQWIFWIIIVNFFIILWWKQYVLPKSEERIEILNYLIILNGLFWFLREYFVIKKVFVWLDKRWTRLLPAITTLIIMFIATYFWIIRTNENSMFGGMLGLIGHGISYFLYRYLFFDMIVLSATVISACIITESYILHLLLRLFLYENYSTIFFLMTLITIMIFSYSIYHLNKIKIFSNSKYKGRDLV
ncbi:MULTISPECIES: DUF2157 domain-containing protein [Candidatus Ichthyocystis]|uniref:Putative membrane protein, DUF2157 family n=1 Tax=Candidatus Ichthyocystis hellenicum TaxID=1561003 RepID=A0A0S4M290_9BURK|nr:MULTISPECIES: DUF2157 domain-containing protein [Ichthyocystis]CUT17745.1 putative membrane protein, DUF2157 family [Candidatus Ichthyocystis hellenicum]